MPLPLLPNAQGYYMNFYNSHKQALQTQWHIVYARIDVSHCTSKNMCNYDVNEKILNV